jgi:hypothetical protein
MDADERMAFTTGSVHCVVSNVLGPPVDEIVLGYDDLIDLANDREHVVYRAPHVPEHLDVIYTTSSREHDRYVNIPGSMFSSFMSFTSSSDQRYGCCVVCDLPRMTHGMPNSRLRIVLRNRSRKLEKLLTLGGRRTRGENGGRGIQSSINTAKHRTS